MATKMTESEKMPTLDDALELWVKFQLNYLRLSKDASKYHGHAGAELMWAGLQSGPMTRAFRDNYHKYILAVCDVYDMYFGIKQPNLRDIENSPTLMFTIDKLHIKRTPNSKEIRSILKDPSKTAKLCDWKLIGIGESVKTDRGRVRITYYPETKCGQPILFIATNHVFDRITQRGEGARNHNLTWSYWLSSAAMPGYQPALSNSMILAPLNYRHEGDLLVFILPPGGVVGHRWQLTQDVAGLKAGTLIFFAMTFLTMNMFKPEMFQTLQKMFIEYPWPHEEIREYVANMVNDIQRIQEETP